MPKRTLAALLFIITAFVPARAEPWWLERLPFNQLRHAGIIGPTDDRGPITIVGPQQGWSQSEINQGILAAIAITCTGNDSSSSGNLIFDNHHIITTVHGVVDEKGPSSDCRAWYRSIDGGIVSEKLHYVPLSFSEFKFRGDRDWKNRPYGHTDWAIFRLDTPIPNGKPFRVDLSNNMETQIVVPRVGDQIFVLGRSGIDYKLKHHTSIPVLTPCFFRSDRRPDGPGLSITTDCDAKPGMSGSMTLTRIDGRLSIIGILTNSPGIKYGGGGDYKEFSLGPWPTGNSTTHARLSDELIFAGLDLISDEYAGESVSQNLLSKLRSEDQDRARKAEQTAKENTRWEHTSERWKGSNGVSGLVRRYPYRNTANGRCAYLLHAVTFEDGFTRAVKGTICRPEP